MLLRDGVVREKELSIVRKDGDYLTVVISSILLNIQGEGQCLLSSFIDVTENKKFQESLRTSLINYQSLLNGMSETAWVIDFNGNFLEVNHAAINVLGYSKEELLSIGITGIDKFLSKEQVGQLIANLPQVKNQVFETVHTAKDGKEIPVEISSSLITYEGKQAILSIARNIEERKKAQDSLRQSEERYRELADSLPEIVFETDFDGKIIYGNKKGFEIMGYEPDDLEKGLHNFDFFAPECVETAKRNYAYAMKTSTPTKNEYVIVKSDGTKFPALIQGIPIKSGGKTVGMRGIVIDLTERKMAEQKLAAVNEKLKVIGSLTRHDIRNKFMAAMTNAYLLKKEAKGNPHLLKYVNAIEDAIHQSQKIFEFSRLYEIVGAEKLSKINVAASVRSSSEINA